MNTIHESPQIDTAMQLKNEQETLVTAKKEKKRINTHVRYGIDYSVFEDVLELCNQDDKLAIQYLDKLKKEVGLVFLSVQDAIECTREYIDLGMSPECAVNAHIDSVNASATIGRTIILSGNDEDGVDSDEVITADEFADTIMQKIESIDDLLDEQKKEALTRLKKALNELDTPIDMEIAEYIGEALNDRTRLCILLNIRALRELIKNSIKDHANGIAITIPKPKKLQYQKESFNVEHIKQLKLADQKIKKCNTILKAQTIGMIKYEITDSGIEVTLKNKFGIKSSKFIRKYLKGKGLKRMGRTIEHGVCFKPELVDEIITDLGIDGVEKEIPNFDMSDMPINLHYVSSVNANNANVNPFACLQT